MRSLLFSTCCLLTASLLAGCQGGNTTGAKGQTSTTVASAKGDTRAEAATKGPKSGPEVVVFEQIFTLPSASKEGEKLTIEEIKKFLEEPENHRNIIPQAPLGIGDLSKAIPADNPMTRAKVELGRQLYFDKRLSRDSSVSCASCHDPAKGWTDQAAVSTGIKGQKGGRSAPTVINRVLGRNQFWDGRAGTLEQQALGPIENPIEMGFVLPELIERLKGIEGYRLQFDKIFGGITDTAIGQAIATFERTVVVGNSPFDAHEQFTRFAKIPAEDLKADADLSAKFEAAKKLAADLPMSDAAKRGRELFFNKAKCSLCHVGENLADEEFYNIGVGMTAADPDKGRSVVSKDAKHLGAFRTPTLRNIAHTAPYMHDGSEKTLADVIDYYDKGGQANPNLHERITKLNLTAEEKKDLVAFLQDALTGKLPKITAPRLP